MYVETSQAFEAVFDSGETGLVGTISVKVIDNDGATTLGPTTANITESTTSGIYIWNAPAAPGTIGQYTIVWSKDGTYAPDTVGIEDLIVVTSTVGTLPAVPSPDDGPTPGPCSAWITGDDVADCCDVETSSAALFDDVAIEASKIMFELSGRLYAGSCGPKTVRPYCHGCACGYQILSRGHIVSPNGTYCPFCLVACTPSTVKLAGYPIREITEVKIDGDVLATSGYRLHNKRYAMRLNGSRWPQRQDLTAPDTDDSTFSITYTYGSNPPEAGIRAALELGCEIYKSCVTGECLLPTGVTRVNRQGITFERGTFVGWAWSRGGWKTGMPNVDAFLNAYNPSGIKRRSVFFSPYGTYAQTWET